MSLACGAKNAGLGLGVAACAVAATAAATIVLRRRRERAERAVCPECDEAAVDTPAKGGASAGESERRSHRTPRRALLRAAAGIGGGSVLTANATISAWPPGLRC